jgi:CheY-like chemotaxis protein
VRAFTVTALQELGYNVIESADGPSAVEILKRTGVDLLLSDVGLPGGLTGVDIVTRAKQIQPGLKALLTTGYARNALIHNHRLDPSIPVITKPFSLNELAKKVRDVLDLT